MHEQAASTLTKIESSIDQAFLDDVSHGLSQSPKSLPCVYFYDEKGSQLFEQICELPEYYPTRAEAEILQQYAIDLAKLLDPQTRLVELGSGSSVKTRYLLEAFISTHGKAVYSPIDVSGSILKESARTLEQQFDALQVQPIEARYEDGFAQITRQPGQPLLVMWLGSSIGNFTREEAVDFLSSILNQLEQRDQLLIGIDLLKEKSILEAAYDDAAGVTAEFNLNLLHRINRELGANFEVNNFRHRAIFNPDEGRVEIYLESQSDQRVHIAANDMDIDFTAGERIHTENAHKYSLPQIQKLASQLNIYLKQQWFDSQRRFSLNLFAMP